MFSPVLGGHLNVRLENFPPNVKKLVGPSQAHQVLSHSYTPRFL
jgi:hypothetical protein